jgi:glucose-1-phosphate cytidylyltransferase
MTGGRVRQAQRYIDGDTFLVTYGDGLSDVDIRALVDYHHQHGKLATVTAVRPSSRFGVLDIKRNNRVASFTEKPKGDGWANAGYFVFNRRVLDYLDGDDCILEREPLERLAAEGQLMAYRHEGFFFAMDTYREYKMLNELWDSGEAPWHLWRTGGNELLLAG